MRVVRTLSDGRSRRVRPAPSVSKTGSAGQSMIETSLAMFLICLIFFGLFQISRLTAARETLFHAAACGARAKTVGFNRFMVSKSIRVAAIPNAGRMTAPEYDNLDPALRQMMATLRPGEMWDEVVQNSNPSSVQADLERARIPEYLSSENYARANFILNYEDWDTINFSIPHNLFGDILKLSVSQNYPLRLPFHRAFYAADSVNLTGTSTIENHYPLYLDDQNR